jgi:hypothetical protein
LSCKSWWVCFFPFIPSIRSFLLFYLQVLWSFLLPGSSSSDYFHSGYIILFRYRFSICFFLISLISFCLLSEIPQECFHCNYFSFKYLNILILSSLLHLILESVLSWGQYQFFSSVMVHILSLLLFCMS